MRGGEGGPAAGAGAGAKGMMALERPGRQPVVAGLLGLGGFGSAAPTSPPGVGRGGAIPCRCPGGTHKVHVRTRKHALPPSPCAEPARYGRERTPAGEPAVWRFPHAAVFETLDGTVERTQDVLALVQAAIRFAKLENMELGGSKVSCPGIFFWGGEWSYPCLELGLREHRAAPKQALKLAEGLSSLGPKHAHTPPQGPALTGMLREIHAEFAAVYATLREVRPAAGGRACVRHAFGLACTCLACSPRILSATSQPQTPSPHADSRGQASSDPLAPEVTAADQAHRSAAWVTRDLEHRLASVLRQASWAKVGVGPAVHAGQVQSTPALVRVLDPGP